MRKTAIAAVGIVVLVALAGCSSTDGSSSGKTQKAKETQAAATDGEQGAGGGAPGRDNSTAQAVTLGAGQHTVGTDAQPGRYVITTAGGASGNLQVDRDGEIMPWVNEILGTTQGIGVPSVTTDLAVGDTIKISGLSAVTFAPAETVSSTTLTTGRWTVGLDIPAGRYTAAPAAGQSGNLLVTSSGGLMPDVNEILGGDYGVPSVAVNLKDGQEILVSGLGSVSFS